MQLTAPTSSHSLQPSSTVYYSTEDTPPGHPGSEGATEISRANLYHGFDGCSVLLSLSILQVEIIIVTKWLKSSPDKHSVNSLHPLWLKPHPFG